jgi:DNA-binding NtrC family response regulator
VSVAERDAARRAPRAGRILVVEDGDALRRGIVRALREGWSDVDEEANGASACARLRDVAILPYDVVVTDLRLAGADGLQVLRTAREREPRTGVVLMTAYGSIETAVEAMRLGAFDFVQKPFELEQLEARVARAVEHARLVREVTTLRAERAARFAPGQVVGSNAEFRAAVELARRVAPTRSTVLITGETGTGKEVIAGLVHGHSQRADAPFVKVNCAALPETLLESELFGHERGAFTGADRTRIGRFEQADGGTLFLDEIGDMAPITQAKLLRVLQEQEFQRLGGTKPIRTDVRIVAATNQRLEEAMQAGRFREDLYFRLAVIEIALPSLRDRREDLVPLAQHFLAEFSRDLGRPRAGFTDAALQRVRAHPWPGNVRELRNTLERAVLMSDGPLVDAPDIGLSLPGAPGAARGSWPAVLSGDELHLDAVERAVVGEALRRAGWVQKEAARLLGVSRRKLNYIVARMGLTHPTWRRHRDAQEPVRPEGSGEPRH